MDADASDAFTNTIIAAIANVMPTTHNAKLANPTNTETG
jgi:hypothetical protein